MIKNIKPSIYIFMILLTACLQSHRAAGQTINASLKKMIDSLVEEDQKWRELWVASYNHEPTGMFSEKEISTNLHRTDSLNYFHLKKIIREIGYPNYDKVGTVSSYNFWLLMQHQDNHPQFQDSVLTLMKVEVDKRKAAPENYAYLLDRVRVNTNRLQVYGTQMEVDPTGTTFQPRPVEDIANLNSRRKSVGLSSIEEYTRTMNERYHGSLKAK